MSPRRAKPGGRSALAALALAVFSWVGLAVPAAGGVACPSGNRHVHTVDQGIQTPAGVVTVSAGSDNVVTVVLAPSKPHTLLFAVPFAIPPGPPA